MADAIADAAAAGLLRSDHLTHIRCEVPSDSAVDGLTAFLARHPVHLISLMDHTPGQRQFRDLEKFFIYYGGKSGLGEEEVLTRAAARQRQGQAKAARNRPLIVELAHMHGVRLASHDDTTLDEVAQAVAEGVTIAEFPTTIEAAEASRAAGMATVMGAPNVVRGGSHSGNAAAADLAAAGALDILSSDYVPASLLVAAFQLSDVKAIGGLPGAVRLVSRNVADATALTDRGDIAVGKRADLIHVKLVNGHPVVRHVWRQGQRVA
jgi:alpha-D-ribose 1-methylphosphonate 5-triphosphate diphosphatase